MNDKHTCPSCGFLVFDEPPGSYDICPVCGWEDDHVQLRFPAMRGGANGGSLDEYQQDAISEFPLSVMETDEIARDPEWRPLKSSELSSGRDQPKSGLQYFEAAGHVSPQYYWKVNSEDAT